MRTRFWRLAITAVVGALLGGVPSVALAQTTQARAAAPGVNVCVFYGICAP
jgi:membrane protein YqaA with SNARE-associated domain